MLLLIRVISLVALIGMATSCSRDPEAAKREYLASGDAYFAKQQYREAIVEYRNAIGQDAHFGEARLRLADAFEALGDVRSAFPELVRAADLLPANPDVQVRVGKVLLLLGQFEDARTRAEQTLQRHPRHVQAQILLANALAGLKDTDGAVREVKEAIELDPNESRTYTNLGVLELARGNNENAEAAFRRAVELAPSEALPHLALANFLWATGRRDAAEEELKRAADLSPENADVNQALGAFFVGTRRLKEAEAYLLKAAKSGDPARRLVLVDYYVLSERLVDAEGALLELVRDPIVGADATVKLARLKFNAGKGKEANGLLDGVLVKSPGHVPALVLRAQLRANDRRVDEALADVVAATKADPSSVQALYMLGLIQVQRRDPDAAATAFQEVLKINPRAAAAQVQLARLHLATGKPEPSTQLAAQAVASAPRSVAARVIFIRALVANRELNRAGTEVTQLLRAAPDFAEVQEAAGVYYLASSRARDARAAFERALVLNPRSGLAIRGLSRLDLDAGQQADADKRVEAAVAAFPNDPSVLGAAADHFIACKAFDKAEATLRRTLAIDADAIEAYGKLARLYVAQNRLDDALREFDTISRKQPRATSAGTMAGMILQIQGKTGQAKARYQQVLQIDPGAAVAANNLAWFYVEEGKNLDVALQLAQSAKARLPDNPDVNDTIGWIYYKKDLPLSALPPLQAAVAKDGSRADYQYHLGMASVKAGRFAEGRAALRKALELQPTISAATEIRQALATIDERIGNSQ